MHTKTRMCDALCDLLVALVAISGQKPPATIRKPPRISGQGASKRGSPLARRGGRWFEMVDAAPSLRADCADNQANQNGGDAGRTARPGMMFIRSI